MLDYRFITLGPLLASTATFIISATFFISDIITEVYGYSFVKKVVLSGLFCL
jgi:uncharacterized PurR-regulated membrane protein YhhQ (DUF165 family)